MAAHDRHDTSDQRYYAPAGAKYHYKRQMTHRWVSNIFLVCNMETLHLIIWRETKVKSHLSHKKENQKTWKVFHTQKSRNKSEHFFIFPEKKFSELETDCWLFVWKLNKSIFSNCKVNGYTETITLFYTVFSSEGNDKKRREKLMIVWRY